ncbi:carboxypeptidase-like regulatory domain-containing protein [Rhodanobacter ginsengiterrae]|uniref:carboxypeptidase-like regulatory domain-containing protein n=1 Tax=Rhodanobacter ginsengiterrae TaxID=2008451 RepID=UPI003CE7C419
MKSWKLPQNMHHGYRKAFRASGFAAAILVCLYGAGGLSTASAQSTSGHIFGQAPAGQTVTAQNVTGLRRHVTVKSGGRYNLTALPAGLYTVVLEKDGAVIDTRKNIPLAASRGAEVDFACPQDKCDAP